MSTRTHQAGHHYCGPADIAGTRRESAAYGAVVSIQIVCCKRGSRPPPCPPCLSQTVGYPRRPRNVPAGVLAFVDRPDVGVALPPYVADHQRVQVIDGLDDGRQDLGVAPGSRTAPGDMASGCRGADSWDRIRRIHPCAVCLGTPQCSASPVTVQIPS